MHVAKLYPMYEMYYYYYYNIIIIIIIIKNQ